MVEPSDEMIVKDFVHTLYQASAAESDEDSDLFAKGNPDNERMIDQVSKERGCTHSEALLFIREQQGFSNYQREKEPKLENVKARAKMKVNPRRMKNERKD